LEKINRNLLKYPLGDVNCLILEAYFTMSYYRLSNVMTSEYELLHLFLLDDGITDDRERIRHRFKDGSSMCL